MKLLIEGYHYSPKAIDSLGRLMGDLTWRDGTKSKNYVGYYYSAQLGDCVFFLPKVVLSENGLLFGRYNPNDVVDVEKLQENTEYGTSDYQFLYKFTVWLYRGLKEFVRLNPDSGIVKMKDISAVGMQGDKVSNTYLDIMLSLQKFQEENPDYFTFIVKNMHSGMNKINWTKTVSRENAIIQDGTPIYLDLVNKKRQVNFDEELLVIFYSILNYMKRVFGFEVTVNYNYELLTDVEFENWIDYYGEVRLKQIRYKYFSDKDLQLWNLCNNFFERATSIHSDKQYKDFLIVTDYHIVFESMVDELLSDKGLDIGDLKAQEDGKRVDHIYAYQGLINKNKIYYIGDSKYYGIGAPVAEYSEYKQYTYARNVIQHNLSLFLEDEKDAQGRRKNIGKTYLIYRDEDTDGYSITPNFFISARISEKEEDREYYEDKLQARDEIKSIRHFENRLFDRDTLLLQHYDINFLFVLSLYAQSNEGLKKEFKERTKEKFRENVLSFLKNDYAFFSLQLKPKVDTDEGKNDERTLDGMHRAIEKHFRSSIGKVFRPYSDEKFMYVGIEDNAKFYEDNHRLLAELSQDFIIRHYTLNTNPTDELNKLYQLEVELDSATSSTNEFIEFENVANEVFLIGGWRKDKNQQDWIHQNMMYNIRRNSNKSQRSGMVKKVDPDVVSAKYLLLYEIGTDYSSYEVYRIDGHNLRGEEYMRKISYNNPDGNYVVYNIKKMPRNFKPINLRKIIEAARIEEMEKRRKEGTLEEGWEEKWYGTPIFKKGKELIEA
ncbi:hypothetical protein PRMUPPPA20_08710 [Xylanibacter ruminicola]|uniref:LlaJI restriction endonuclease n=2 Tax=Xylanibacter ruminicola TaxID=839 RepID=D5EWX1_XYLR2|nr:LlaJI family restriction endonuclease [Xylanibacter ruminicola]ADE83069.1 hypothetical protein PRU_0359 [Xylanibacter ruminicola 23]GJG32762.1 hypothetical protein PRMUPPPA20_08710 [Xylanibacter ruminicola]SEH95415.1 LlaJI restriction endonuclease [Xylanibacter ruminicola]